MRRLFLLLTLLPALAACESKTIQGRVVDLFGRPVEGVVVKVANSGFLATTDSEGYYQLDYAPANEILLSYAHPDTTQRLYDRAVKKVSIVEKSRYPMPDVELCYVPARTRDQLWLMQDGEVSELPRTEVDRKTLKVEGPFTPIKPDASIAYYFDSDKGKDELCYPMLLCVSEKTGRLELDLSQRRFPFKGYTYDDITYVGVVFHVARIEHHDQLPKGRYVLCLLDVKRGTIAGTHHGVVVE